MLALGMRMDKDLPVARVRRIVMWEQSFQCQRIPWRTQEPLSGAYRNTSLQRPAPYFSFFFNLKSKSEGFFFTFPRCCTPCIPPPATEVTPKLVPLGTTSVLGQQPGFASSTGKFTPAFGEG